MGKSDPDVTRRQPNPPPTPRADDTTAPALRSPDDLTAPGPAAAASVTGETDTTALTPEHRQRPSPPAPVSAASEESPVPRGSGPASPPAARSSSSSQSRRSAPVSARPARGRPQAGRRPPPIGAIPQTPTRPKTITEKVLGKAKRDWSWTAVTIILSVICGVAAIALLSSGHAFTGAIALAAIVPLSLAALFVRRAPCPSCGKPLMVMDLDECNHCHKYIYVEDSGELKVAGPGFVAKRATFEIKVPLPLVERLNWMDEKACCVCGDVAVRSEVQQVQNVRVVIPHCGEHEQGVLWSLSLSSDAVTMVTFMFQSYDFYMAFQEANAQHLRAGMWR